MVRRTLRKLKREWDNAEPPQPGLEPIMGDIYGSPPADPRDCARWPDSPWCGGNPLSRQPIAYNFSFVRDECNIGVQLDATFGFIKMPSVQVVYRNPACKIELPPPLPPSENEETEPYIPPVDANLWAVIEKVEDGTQGRRYNSFNKPQGWFQRRRELIIKSFTINQDFTSSFEIEVIITSVFNGIHFVYNGYNEDNLGETVSYDLYNERTLTRERETINLEILETGDSPEDYKTVYQDTRILQVWSQGGLDVLDNYSTIITRGGTREELKSFLQNVWWAKNTFDLTRGDIRFGSGNPDDFPLEIPGFEPGEINIESSGSDIYGYYYFGTGKNLDVNYFKREIIVVPLDVPNIVPPPPIPRMKCCPKVQENDELLRLIAKRLGAYDYPVSVPKILTDRGKGTESIENLTRFHSWLGKQLDALCGNYPVEIEIEDSDLTQDGNQTKNLKIPNISEGIAEMLGMLLQIQAETSATLNAAIRTLIETSSTKKTAIITHDYAVANAEFLGYKGTQEVRKTPFMCSPGKERLDEILEESVLDVRGWENTDEQDIKDLLAPLLEMASMYRGQNFRNLGTSDPASALTNILKKAQLSGLIDLNLKNDKLDRYNKKDSKDPKELKEILENDFDKFTEEAENGFIAKPGIKDNTNPYGRPYEERPRIREIGNTTGE